MKFALLILCDPNDAGAHTALQFAQAVVATGHQISRVFFYGRGAYFASTLQQPPQTEIPAYKHWQSLALQHNIDLVVCIAAGLRRGIVDKTESNRYQLGAQNLAENFHLSGLGQLIEASALCDRLITFG